MDCYRLISRVTFPRRGREAPLFSVFVFVTAAYLSSLILFAVVHSTAVVNNGNWRHVVAIAQRTFGFTFYVDGVLDSSMSQPQVRVPLSAHVKHMGCAGRQGFLKLARLAVWKARRE